MAKCPKCGGELSPQENGLWQCSACGKLFRIKQKTTPESTQGADVPPVNGSGADVPPVQTTPVAPAAPAQEERSQAAEIEELKRRLAEMERRQSEQQPASHSGAAASAAAVKFAPVVEFLKKYGLKVVLPVTLLVVAFITLCACFMGLRGIYVNVDNPNEFISFNATNYEWYYNSMLGETVDKGTWSKSGNTLNFVVDDELFGEVEDPYDVTNFSWDGFTLVDSFGAEKRYERVSLICYKDNISKVTVTFDLNGGTGSADSRKIKIGSVLSGAPEDPEILGGTFLGWNTSPDGNGDWLSATARIWEDVTYYAVWNVQWDMEYTSDGGLQLNGFADGSSIPSVLVIPDGVTIIGDAAFRGCTSLASVTMPDSVMSIGQSAFNGCIGLQFATIGNGVTSIGDAAFEGCIGLRSITIPGSVTSIGSNAFYNCDGLTSITIPGSVTSIGDSAFYGCTNIVTATMPTIAIGRMPKDSLQTVVLTSGESIGADSFRGCDTLTSITIPDSVTSIGNSAFSDCTSLTSISIPDSVTSIGSYAFNGCSGLTSITIPDSVTSIGYSAFEDCSGLTSVIIGNGMTSIGSYAFYGCTSLTTITIPDSVTSIGSSAFSGCDNLERNEYDNAYYLGNETNPYLVLVDINDTSITSFTISEQTRIIYQSAFAGYTGLTSITIPDSVTSIGDRAFYGCNKLIEVYNKSSLDITAGSSANGEVARYAKNVYTEEGGSWFTDTADGFRFFYDGTDGYLMSYYGEETAITLPDGFTAYDGTEVTEYAIYDHAFRYCNDLTSVTIPDSVTSIGDYAFAYCTGLTSVIIPDSVTSIGSGAFSGCSSLESITIPFVGAAAGKTSSDTYQYPFGYIFGTASYTGGAAVRQYYYGSSTSSSTYSTYYVPSSLRSVTVTGGNILYGAFYNCSMLTSVTIGNGVTSIGDYAFYGCSGLTSITIPDSVTSIGYQAFYGCSSLTSVTIPDSVTSIGSRAFRYCTGLTSVTFEGTVAEWNAIEKDSYWNQNCPFTEVVCSDGVVEV